MIRDMDIVEDADIKALDLDEILAKRGMDLDLLE